MRHVAHEYAVWGLSLHPLPPGEKKSRTPWAERQRVAMTVAEVDAHWSEHPDDNVAIITGHLSGVVVVDVDPTHGGDPAPFVGTTPVIARTRSGGWHFYYAHPGHHVKSCARPNPELPGVDVRGDGGYVVAPPSKVEPGEYAWEGPAIFMTDRTKLPSFDVVERRLFQKSSNDDSPVTIFTAVEESGWLTQVFTKGAQPGEQRHVLTKLAGYFARKGVPSDVSYGILYSQVVRWKQNCSDPWMPDQVRDLVESIYERDARRSAADPLLEPETTTASAPGAEVASAPGRLRLVWCDEFMDRWEGTQAQWTVEDWLPQATVAMTYSPPGSFKTWLLAEIAVSVAMGEPFLGRYPVHTPGPVIFIQSEDPAPLLASRLGPLLVSKHHVTGTPLNDEFTFGLARPRGVKIAMVTDGTFNFGVEESKKALVRRIEEVRPALVILDPLYAMAPSGNFFADIAGSAGLGFLKRVRDKFGCSFLIAHHKKKLNAELGDQGREQMFGSNLLNAAIETGWSIRPIGAKAVILSRHFKVSGNKDARKFEFEIDTERVPAMSVREVGLDDQIVDPAEKDQIDDDHRLIIATLRQEAKPMATRALARLIGRTLSVVQRKVSDLQQRGILLRDDKKQLRLTEVKPEEVA